MTADHGHEGDRAQEGRDPDDEVPPAPWSFKIMVVLAVIYLAWRLVQGVVWVAERVL